MEHNQEERSQNSFEIKKKGSGGGKPGRKGGAPKGNRNAAKLGRDLKYQSYMSKTTRALFEEFFMLRFGRKAHSERELIQLARQIADGAIKHQMAEEFERHDPGRVISSIGEVF